MCSLIGQRCVFSSNFFQNLGSFEVKEVQLDDKIDTEFKAGIHAEVESFLGNKKDLCTIEEQVANLRFYQQILEGKH